MLSRQAFTSLQHGFLRSVENVFIHNFVTPNGVWGNIFFMILTLNFLLLLLGRCYALLCHGRCYCLADVICLTEIVADVIANRKLLSYIYKWQMLLPILLW